MTGGAAPSVIGGAACQLVSLSNASLLGHPVVAPTKHKTRFLAYRVVYDANNGSSKCSHKGTLTDSCRSMSSLIACLLGGQENCMQYHKNGNGQLVKCWHERIAEDFTNHDLKCPNCGQQFARKAMVRGLPANKIIGGKVIVKR
jgi:predicted RNA-binding Zn-ribbon protein involved in translation (DUF1610 family)